MQTSIWPYLKKGPRLYVNFKLCITLWHNKKDLAPLKEKHEKSEEEEREQRTKGQNLPPQPRNCDTHIVDEEQKTEEQRKKQGAGPTQLPWTIYLYLYMAITIYRPKANLPTDFQSDISVSMSWAHPAW